MRHPIYSGFLIMVLGTTLAKGRLIGIVILAACTSGLYLKALREESFLKLQFPDTYPAYRARTKALIPYLR